jgi:hypothetical protein
MLPWRLKSHDILKPRRLLPWASVKVHTAWQTVDPLRLPPRERHKIEVGCWAVDFGVSITGLSEASPRDSSLNMRNSNNNPDNRNCAGGPSSTRITNQARFLLQGNKWDGHNVDQPTINRGAFDRLPIDFCLAIRTEMAKKRATCNMESDLQPATWSSCLIHFCRSTPPRRIFLHHRAQSPCLGSSNTKGLNFQFDRFYRRPPTYWNF